MERACRNCDNFEDEGENIWSCSKGMFKNEPGKSVREEEYAEHCGRKFSGSIKRESKFEQYLETMNEEQLDEAEINWKSGHELTPEQQKEVKAKYVHRHTGDNKPEWTKQIWKDGKPYPLQHKNDKDWLENTKFAVTKKGELHKGTKYCDSKPSWPNNPELRKTVKESINEDSLTKDQNIKSAINILKNVMTNQMTKENITAKTNIKNALVYLEDSLGKE